MKKLIYIIIIFLFCVKTHSQCNYTNSINVSTGVDNSGNQLPIGIVDPNWQLLNNAPLRTQCSANYTPFVLPSQDWTTNHNFSRPTAWANLAGTRALGPADPAITSSAGGDNFNCSNANASQPFVYDRLFCLDVSASVTLNLEFKGDDYCTLALIDPNGNVIQNAPVCSWWGSFWGDCHNTYNLTTVGTYRLRAYSRNTAHHSIGFSVRGTISSSNNVLANSSPQCCRDYAITIQKILDNNCDGIYNAGDLNGTANWVFDILPLGSNTPVFTGTTNNNGELIVTGLVAGTYIVREQSNTLSSYNIPFSNDLQVTIGDNNLVGMVNFYNCQPNHLKIRKILDNDCDGVYGKLDQVGGSGWTFDVYSGNNIIGTATTNSLGIATLSGLPSGNYTIYEQPNPGSIYPNPFQNGISITYDATVIQRVDFFNCPSKLNIRKILDDNCDGIFGASDQVGSSGWTFDIYNGGNIVGSATTDSSGIATFTGLPSGNYTIIEQPNPGSSFSSPYQTNMQLTYDNSTSQTIDFFNCRDSQLNIRKIYDEDCDGVFGASDQIGGSGWTFKLYSGNTIFATATTNNSGIATFRGLPSGNYSIVEQPNLTSSYPSPFQVNISTLFDESVFQTIDFFNCPPQPFPDCCENPLDISSNYEGQDVPSIDVPMADGNNISVAGEVFTFNSDATIPITEVRAVITDFDFEYNYEQCAQCIDNPALWGSIIGDSDPIGSSPNALKRDPAPLPWFGDWNNLYNNNINNREIIWKSDKGEMINAGDDFQVNYLLPPVSEIPCCATSVKVCLEISYKDANCNVCTEQVCSIIEISEDSRKIKDLSISVENEGCCDRTLIANSNVYANYQWSTGETTKQITVSQNGTYSVTATSGGSSITQNVAVNDIAVGSIPILDHTSRFDPTGNTPNMHDKFYIFDSAQSLNQSNAYNATKYKLWIFNRWGERIRVIEDENCSGFKNYSIQWDGKDKYGNLVKQDTYEWRFFVQNCTFKNDIQVTFRTGFEECGCEKWFKLFGKKIFCISKKYCVKTEKVTVGHVNVLR